jgi:hypothetical protein
MGWIAGRRGFFLRGAAMANTVRWSRVKRSMVEGEEDLAVEQTAS